MKPDIENMFDSNACLTKRQIKDYLSAVMSTEEIEAVERHFSTCPLCREAMDGYLAHSENALEALNTLDSHFLKEQIGHIQQQHPAKPIPVLTKPARKRRGFGSNPTFNSLVPVILIAGMFILFQNELSKPIPHKALTQPIRPTQVHAEPVVTHGLREARAEAVPTPAQPKRLPEAPVGRNLKMPAGDAVAVRTDSGTGHVVVAAPKIVVPPVAGQPVATPQVTAPGVASVSASSSVAATVKKTPSRPKPEALKPPTVNNSDDFFDEPDIVKVPPKPIGPQPDNTPAQSKSAPAPERPRSDTGGH